MHFHLGDELIRSLFIITGEAKFLWEYFGLYELFSDF